MPPKPPFPPYPPLPPYPPQPPYPSSASTAHVPPQPRRAGWPLRRFNPPTHPGQPATLSHPDRDPDRGPVLTSVNSGPTYPGSTHPGPSFHNPQPVSPYPAGPAADGSSGASNAPWIQPGSSHASGDHEYSGHSGSSDHSGYSGYSDHAHSGGSASSAPSSAQGSSSHPQPSGSSGLSSGSTPGSASTNSGSSFNAGTSSSTSGSSGSHLSLASGTGSAIGQPHSGSSAGNSGSSSHSGSAGGSGSSAASGGGSGSSTHPQSGTGSASASGSASSGHSSASGAAPQSGSGSGSLSHRSTFDVEPISLSAVASFHSGTGTWEREQLVVDPSSIPGSANLAFVQKDVQVTTRLYQISKQVVPNWFGVAVPANVTDFSHPNIYFHPSPGQAGYKDIDYASKTGMWPDLFYYMELLGYQFDAAIKYFGGAANQVIIMPFLTSAATNTGIFAPNWHDIVVDILTDVRDASGFQASGPVEIADVVVSSFSVGYVYSEEFRSLAPGLAPLLQQVWDFDGYPKSDSSRLSTTGGVTATKYDQASEPSCYHVGLSRWVDYPKPAPDPADWPAPGSGSDVHRAIINFMPTDAASRR